MLEQSQPFWTKRKDRFDGKCSEILDNFNANEEKEPGSSSNEENPGPCRSRIGTYLRDHWKELHSSKHSGHSHDEGTRSRVCMFRRT